MESAEITYARQLWDIDQEEVALATKVKALAERRAVVENNLITYLVDNGKTGTGHIEGIGTFQLKRENLPSVTKAHMPQFFGFVRAEEAGELIEEHIPPATIKRWCKEKIEAIIERCVDDPDYAVTMQTELGIPLDEVVPPAELAKRYLAQFGVSVFQRINLSHTKRGK